MLDKTMLDPVAFAGGILGGIFAFIISATLIYYILFIIASWKIFKKAGEAGWKSLIPLYNIYIFYKIVGMKKWFWILILASFIISIVTTSMGFDNNNIMNNSLTGINPVAFLLIVAETILAVIVSIMYCIKTSRAFGHGAGYAVGLFFLQIIFLMIIGFGKSKYNKKLVRSWEK